MKAAGVIGWPIAHSKSPVIHRFWLRALGLEGDYSRLAVPPERLGDALRGLAPLGFSGVNVTVPHKVAAMRLVDVLDDAARDIGAVNIVQVLEDGSLYGANSDARGFLEPLRAKGFAGQTATVIGNGGAARAVLWGLRELGIARVQIVARAPERGLALLRAFDLVGGAQAMGGALPAADLVVNATSLGMQGQPALAADLSQQSGDVTVYDLVYAPLETDLLADARARGFATIDGLAMLIGQAAVAFRLFFGVDAPRDRDAELRALLVAGAEA